MTIPLQITFHGIDPSQAVEQAVREKADKLSQFSDHITSCRVTIDAPHKHRHKGRTYTVGVDLVVPDSEIVASRDPAADHAHEDVYVAVREAFDSVRRQLKEYEERRRGEVKTHESPVPRG